MAGGACWPNRSSRSCSSALPSGTLTSGSNNCVRVGGGRPQRLATRWLPDAPRDAAVWIENIPYNETRDYVQRVLWHSVVFGWRRSGEPQKLDAWLGQIAMPVIAPAPQSVPQPGGAPADTAPDAAPAPPAAQ